jgi:hypothetical protein
LGSGGGGGGGGDSLLQSGKKMMVPPTIVQVTPHANGATAGGSAVTISPTTIPVAIVGRIRRATNFTVTPARRSSAPAYLQSGFSESEISRHPAQLERVLARRKRPGSIDFDGTICNVIPAPGDCATVGSA